jgi:TrmH family RNA methyltransferase
VPLSAAHFKQLRSLRTAKGRAAHGCFLIEGEKLIREAIDVGAPIVELLATDARTAALPPGDVTTISAKDAARLSDTRGPQGCFAVVRDTLPAAADALATLPPEGPSTVVALDGVQDPGNAGALIRLAAAFDAGAVLTGPGTADPVHPRVVRAATGAWFRIAIVRAPDLAADLRLLSEHGYEIVGAATDGPSVWDEPPADLAARRALVLGNEGAGFSPDVAAVIDRRVGVPISPRAESLNVAVAAGIILGAWSNRRRRPAPAPL